MVMFLRAGSLPFLGAFFILLFLIKQDGFAQDKYSPAEKEYMLSLAREAITTYLRDNRVLEPKTEELTANLKETRPCFVTLEKKSYGLRGCVGLFAFTRPLYLNIIDKAIAAAIQDQRFIPVKYEELSDIKIEISILTEPVELKFDSPQDLLNKLRQFEDGVILSTDYGESTYLPQVWEQVLDKEEFLSSLCQKHGAPADYWRVNYKRLKVRVYKAKHFGEESYGGKKSQVKQRSHWEGGKMASSARQYY